MLTFDAAAHEYRWEGKSVPGVTTVLSPITDFSRVPPATLNAARDFGTAVHLACELDDLGQLDEVALDPLLAPYLAGWRAFCRDHQTSWAHVEHAVYHRGLRYAGTLDRAGDVSGRPAVVDIKSGSALYPSVGPQLAAYANAHGQPGADRIAVRLKPDGTYQAKRCTDPRDFAVFCSLLTLRTWCADHSITPTFQ